MHLTHPANTLGAEINLAAQATGQRVDKTGALITDARSLICCSGYGSANRSSDPTIGQAVNLSVRGAVSLTLSNPVGLYMDGLKTNGQITGPAGEDLSGWFKIVRGSSGRVLPAEFGPPPGSAFGLESVLVKGVPLEAGAQIAQLIRMVLYAKVVDLHMPASPNAPCVQHCCVGRGATLATSNLKQVSRNQACSGNCNGFPCVEAYPNLLPSHGTPLALNLRTRIRKSPL